MAKVRLMKASEKISKMLEGIDPVNQKEEYEQLLRLKESYEKMESSGNPLLLTNISSLLGSPIIDINSLDRTKIASFVLGVPPDESPKLWPTLLYLSFSVLLMIILLLIGSFKETLPIVVSVLFSIALGRTFSLFLDYNMKKRKEKESKKNTEQKK